MMQLIYNKNILIFLISSFFSIITIAYIYISFNKSHHPIETQFEMMVLFLPIIYGIVGVINYYIIENYGDNFSLFVGAIMGLLLSMVGRFILDLPQKIFNFNKNNEKQVHIYAMILYAIILRFIITPVSKYIIN
jgi:uncharacterized membrane protein YeaQ/YmgE (transglycosylase-associated protein family)